MANSNITNSSSSSSVLKRYGTFAGTAGEARPLGDSGAFAATFKPEAIVSDPEGVKRTAAQRKEVLRALAKYTVEFTGSSEWIPEAGPVEARIELVEYTSRTGKSVCRLQAVMPYTALSDEEKSELLDLN